ncbi:MAG: outer-membrane lipoprotein carrier protein LolA [Muribaculaceae bacterium]|nr:outer-membrane lipoprotein carrier protein LolA [Muribaculaceae bacterium]
MNRFVLTLIIALTAVFACQALTPRQAVDRAAAKLKGSATTRVAYTMTADGRKTRGLLTIAGNRFTVSSPGMASWYDGKTQWTYSDQMGEVNVVTPTADELQQINPLAIISSLASDFTLSSVKAPKGYTTVSMKAKSTSKDLRDATVTFSDATSLPTQIRGILAGGHRIEIEINSITPGGVLPDSYFRFDPKKYPGVQVVDLR